MMNNDDHDPRDHIKETRELTDDLTDDDEDNDEPGCDEDQEQVGDQSG